MKANTENFQEIFGKNEHFTVPFFQRRYVWGEDEWKRCLEDVRTAAENNAPHFMGSLIFKNENNSCVVENLVIDGQQRMTTLFLLYYALCTIRNEQEKLPLFFCNSKGERKISHNHCDCSIFNWIIYENCSSDSCISEEVNHHPLVKCLHYFFDELKEDNVTLPETIEELLYFVTISLDATDDEQAIFETINSLGVELTTAELLKNDLYRNESVDFFNKTWGCTFESVYIKNFWDSGAANGKSEKTTNIDLFLRAYYDIVAESSCDYKKFNSLFKLYQKFLARHTVDKETFINDLIFTANLYKRSFNSDILATDTLNLTPLQRICFITIAFHSPQIIPYILYVQKEATAQDADKIFHLLETYIIRRRICDLTTARYGLQFQSLIVSKINTYEALVERLKTNDEDTSRIPSPKEVWNALVVDNRKLTLNSLGKVLLYFIEIHLRKISLSSGVLTAYDKISIEYLMPKKLDKWSAVKELAEEDPGYVNMLNNKLGNLTLSTKKLSSAASSEPWDIKVQSHLSFYCKEYMATMPYLDLEFWNINAINKRTCELADIILDIWKTDLDDSAPQIFVNKTNIRTAREQLASLCKHKQAYEIKVLYDSIDPSLGYFKEETESALLRTIAAAEKQELNKQNYIMTENNDLKFFKLNERDFSGSKPASFKFFDSYYQCSSGWKDFMLKFLGCCFKHSPEKMKIICSSSKITHLSNEIPYKFQNTGKWVQCNDYCAVRVNLNTATIISIIRSVAYCLDFDNSDIMVSLKKGK